MNEQEIFSLWNSQNQKLDESLQLNKEIIKHLTKQKLDKTIGKLRLPKLGTLFIGIPYFILLVLITFVAFKAKATFVFIGFGLIALLMYGIIVGYCYHLYLIAKIRGTEDLVSVQKQLAQLKLSNYNLTKLAILQLPLWSICWISVSAIKSSPWVYGGINLLVFGLLCYITYWLFMRLDIRSGRDSKVYHFFFSGNEWETLHKSNVILEELREYEK
ncbi:MAG: hypothetical protein P1U56_25180 [Saprospiraceae bacterium]|nr:hypothetical protein [Saprospiraceae bacterium]